MPLGMLPFLPPEIVSKVASFAIFEDDDYYDDDFGDNKSNYGSGSSGVVRYRTVASIDVLPESGFVITSTVGDVLTWDSRAASSEGDNDPKNDPVAVEMEVVLGDGASTSFTKNVFCGRCSAVSVVSTDKAVRAAFETVQDVFDHELLLDNEESAGGGKTDGLGIRRRLARHCHRFNLY